MAQQRVCICKQCGEVFIGWPQSLYCKECGIKRRREQSRKRSAQQYVKKSPATKQYQNDPCYGCSYWRRISGMDGVSHCCHYLLLTGKRRERDGDRCLSKTSEVIIEDKPAW